MAVLKAFSVVYQEDTFQSDISPELDFRIKMELLKYFWT
jgi:hypothetical protein